MPRPTKRARVTNADTFAQVSNLEDYRMKELPDSEVYYPPSFVSEELSEEWYPALLELDSWYRPKLKVYGREVTQSRKIAAYSTDPDLILKYSGQTVDMKYEYPPVLRAIQDQVEERLGVKFNHVMLNLYDDINIPQSSTSITCVAHFEF
ncbi:hypothetical protein GALMADRAFT_765543 [Galerina marginata CBS 339.88]|uniref:Uncharacterized protein n=1 Tax=Galerina marginata (strain CBS 339.88) TaxID=685588 RepID=A0A067SMK7_GALM3|nr:hypothetical protein GALMADRAFT_765543 [Galerina marginata CBS 339.88]